MLVFLSLANIVGSICQVNWTTGCTCTICKYFLKAKKPILIILTSKNHQRGFSHDIMQAMSASVTIFKQWNFLYLSMRFFMQKNGLMFGIPTWLANVKTLQWRQKITSTYADNLSVVDTNLSSHYHEKLEDNWQSLITAGFKLSHWAFELSVSLNSTVRQTIFLGYSQLNNYSLRYCDNTTSPWCMKGILFAFHTWKAKCCAKIFTSMERMQMTLLQPNWSSKTMKCGPCWCTKPILCEFNFFLV